MNLYNRIKARIVGFHADWYTGFSRLEEKYRDKFPAAEPAEETAEEPEELPEPEVNIRVYTQELAQELAKKLKEETGYPFGRMRVRHSVPHVRVVPEPLRRMSYPGTSERGRILDYLSENGWTELAVVSDHSKNDGPFQFQGRFAGGPYAKYEVFLGVRHVDDGTSLKPIKDNEIHGAPKPVTWLEGEKIDETATS